jgi:hypothetical protein
MRIIPPRTALLLAALTTLAACQGAPPALDAQPAPAPGAAVPLRQTDFRNFRYEYEGSGWTLVNGRQPENGADPEWRYVLDDVSFGDVTGDGREEALVTITAETGGTMVPHWIFVYGAGSRGPELLWAFASGDRAAGGLKAVYAEGGTLVVELLGQGKVPHDPATYGAEDDSSMGACCPSRFTRSRYAWNGRAFRPRGEPQVLPYDPDA